MKTVCVVGLGYIGLPTAVIAAQRGLRVIGFDIDRIKVENINQGIVPHQEAELHLYLRQAIKSQQFYATTTMQKADYFIIAVPTPCSAEKKADVQAVWQAVDSVIAILEKNNTIIIESTVPVGTTKKIAQYVHQKTGFQPGVDIFIAHCPERVLPSNIFHELQYNARLIGGINTISTQKAVELYEIFVDAELHQTNDVIAELVKLVENSYRDVNIAFALQVAAMAEHLNLNPYEVIHLANKHPRVNILQPRCGVGGHCIAVDPWFLIETFPAQTSLLSCARTINDQRPQEIIQRLQKIAQDWQRQHNRKCSMLFLGLTYKPDIDDLRESPALHIAQQCNQLSAMDISVIDPYVSLEFLEKEKLKTTSLAEGIFSADCIVILVGHTVFKKYSAQLQTHHHVIDLCGSLFTTKKNNEKLSPAVMSYASSPAEQ